MKTLKYLKLALFALLIGFTAASCMDDDWKDPTGDESPFGNNSLQETNVMPIKALKEKYGALQKDKVNDTVRIDDGVQIKGRVTGNDIEGNLYNEITIEDGSEADGTKAGIVICIAQGGMNGQLQIGQEVLVNVGGLYYGTYRTQPQIGVAYTDFSKNQTYPSRISRVDWQERFKVTGKADLSLIAPKVFDNDASASGSKVSELNTEATAYAWSGCLVTLKNVEFAEADGTVTFAPESEGSSTGFAVTRYFKGYTGQKKQIGIRTSCYADFAANKLPQGKVNVTGVLTCYKSSLTSSYGNTVQLVLRRYSDIEILEPEKNK